jgi:hypothetical protein
MCRPSVLEDARERLLHDVIGRALVAAFRAPGFRIQAWCAGAASALLGGASLVYPDRASSFGRGWGAFAWHGELVSAGIVELEARRLSFAYRLHQALPRRLP